ncbi:LOB domain-containing protein 10, partial [Linum grandiflorum]
QRQPVGRFVRECKMLEMLLEQKASCPGPVDCPYYTFFPPTNLGLRNFDKVKQVFRGTFVEKLYEDIPRGEDKELTFEALLSEADARIRNHVMSSFGTIKEHRQEIRNNGNPSGGLFGNARCSKCCWSRKPHVQLDVINWLCCSMNNTNPAGGLVGNARCSKCRWSRKAFCRGPVDCPYYTSFPPTNLGRRNFDKVKQVFGGRFVKKLYKDLARGEDKELTFEALLCEADARIRNPVMGSFGTIKERRQEIRFPQNRVRVLEQQLH